MSPTFNEGCGPLVSGVEYDTILPADTQALVILLVSLPHAIFPSETLPVIPVVTFKAADVEASVEPIELAVILPYIAPLTDILPYTAPLTDISPLIYVLVMDWILPDDETVPISF